jgi:hypothetical protein
MATKHYVGWRQGVASVFKCAFTPTQATHGSLYASVTGPFRTKRGALFMAFVGKGNNPHVRSVSDAERIAKRQA